MRRAKPLPGGSAGPIQPRKPDTAEFGRYPRLDWRRVGPELRAFADAYLKVLSILAAAAAPTGRYGEPAYTGCSVIGEDEPAPPPPRRPSAQIIRLFHPR